MWHRTLDGSSGKRVQVDRGARPSQSFFLAGDEQAAYLAGEPVNDARFIAAFAHSLVHTGGYTQQEAMRVAMSLLPDILYYDPRRAAAFPENGRTLTDDVMDVFLPMLTNGKVAGHGVGAHKDLLTDFPYLGSPHQDRTAQLIAA